jgi:DNA-binding transcriptional ArsR family regulator
MTVDVDDSVVSGKREKALVALRAHGELTTAELSEETDIPYGSRGHHFGQLRDAGLIEKVGEDESGPGSPTAIYALTDAGEEVAEHAEARAIAEQDVEELRETVGLLTSRVEDLENELSDAETRRQRMAEMIDVLLEQNPDAKQKVGELAQDWD